MSLLRAGSGTLKGSQRQLTATDLPLSRLAWKLGQGSAVKIVAMGDSVLEGTTVTADGGTLGVSDALSRVRLTLAATYPSATITQSNRAVSGRTVATSFANGDVNTAIADAGDFYIIGYGKNDIKSDNATPGTGYPKAQSARGFEKIIRRLRDEVPGADIVILLENPYTSGSSLNTYLQAYSVLIRQLATHYGLAIADTYAAFVAVGNYEPLLSDGTHPNSVGHQLVASTILALIPAVGAPIVPAVPSADRFGASGMSRLWESRTTAQSSAAVTQGGRYVISGTWSSSTTAPHVTSTAGALVRVLSFGDEVHLRLDCGAGTGVVDIAVDENLTKIVGLDLTAYPAGQRYIAMVGLGPGAHTVTVTYASGTVTFRGFDVPTRQTYSPTVDGAKVVRTGTWTVNTLASTTPHGVSIQSSTLGDSVAVTFFGTGLVMAHNAYGSNHFVDIRIDGGSWVNTNVAIATAGGLFRDTIAASGLSLGVHVVDVRSTGSRNALVIYDFTALDETATGYRRDLDLSSALRVTA